MAGAERLSVGREGTIIFDVTLKDYLKEIDEASLLTWEKEHELGTRGVDYFDPDRGTRFSTYAAWWIKQSIKRALLENVQPIHVPTYMVTLINQWRYTASEVEGRVGRKLTGEEMADLMHLPEM